MNGPHVHLECRVWHDATHCPSSPDYCILDPEKALAGAGKRTFTTAPDWLSDAQIKAMFPDARADGIRTQNWIKRCIAGHCPRFVSWWFADTPQELGEFADGSLIDVNGNWIGGAA